MTELESFIPLRRLDVLQLCAEASGEAEKFLEFGRLLLSLQHHESLELFDELKDAYAEFDPDRDTIRLERDFDPDLAAGRLAEAFEQVLLAANYRRLSHEELEEALKEASLVPIHTEVDLSDYEDFAFFYRGSQRKTVTVGEYFFRKELEVENLQRVAVLLRFKDQAHFDGKPRGQRFKQLDFEPGKIYLYLYKNVPKNDLELLFPTVKVSMTWRDKLLFAVPAVAGLGPLLLRVLPSLGLVVGLVALFVLGPDFARRLNFDPEKHLMIYPLLLAALSASFTLGGFAVRQYLNYKNKRLKFQKRVTDTLFFKNLVSNRGVIASVMDRANEELGKEMLLAYGHLLASPEPMTTLQLDQACEEWILKHSGCQVDFHVEKALERLQRFQADGEAVIQQTENGWVARPLAEAKRTLDQHWDHLFEYYSPLGK